MMNLSRILAVTCLAIVPACGGQVVGDQPGVESALSANGNRMSETLKGEGKGYINATPFADANTGLSVHIELKLIDAHPLTTYYLQRAAEAPLLLQADGTWAPNPLSPDGICQNAAIPGKFATFPPFVTGNFMTDADGHADTAFDFSTTTSYPFHDGTTFDVEFRAVDSTAAPTSDIRSDCLQVTVL